MRFLLCLIVALAASPAVADPDPFLSRLAGQWVGRGAMQQDASAESERVFCKVTNTLSPDGQTLVQDGRCALPGNSGPISGEITAIGGNAYTGTLDSVVSRGPAKLNGAIAEMAADKNGKLSAADGKTADADRIPVLQMNAEYVDRGGDAVKALNSIIPVAGGGYILMATRTAPDGSSYTASRIVFTAK